MSRRPDRRVTITSALQRSIGRMWNELGRPRGTALDTAYEERSRVRMSVLRSARDQVRRHANSAATGDDASMRAWSLVDDLQYELEQSPRDNPSCAKPSRLEVKRIKTGAKLPPLTVSSSDTAARAAAKLIGDRAYEVFLVLYLNAANCVIGYEELTEDSFSSVSVNPGSLMRNAMLAGASAILTVHQHPAGSAMPSDADRSLWERLNAQGKLMGVPVLDNLTIAEGEFFSEGAGYVESMPGGGR